MDNATRPPHFNTTNKQQLIINKMRNQCPTIASHCSTDKKSNIVNSYQDDYTTVNLLQDHTGYSSQKCKLISGRVKGASGSWAEPYFACPTLRYGGFAYPPGILYRVFTGKRKEKRIPGGILYNQINTYTDIRYYASKKLNDGRY